MNPTTRFADPAPWRRPRDRRGRPRARGDCESSSAIVENAKSMPLSSSAIVVATRILELIDAAQTALPEELAACRAACSRTTRSCAPRAEYEAARAARRGTRAGRAHGEQRTEIAARPEGRGGADPRSTPRPRPGAVRHEAEDYVDRKLAGVRDRARPDDPHGPGRPRAPAPACLPTTADEESVDDDAGDPRVGVHPVRPGPVSRATPTRRGARLHRRGRGAPATARLEAPRFGSRESSTISPCRRRRFHEGASVVFDGVLEAVTEGDPRHRQRS